MTDTLTVEIPADVKDNSETVTDYAFMRHRSPSKGAISPQGRDRQNRINREYLSHMYTYYAWSDVNPNGQRCRFDMWVDEAGQVVNLFHTEYWTRGACAECEHSYASVYQVITTEDGDSLSVPRCEEHADRFRRLCRTEGVTLHESERLLIGQHG